MSLGAFLNEDSTSKSSPTTPPYTTHRRFAVEHATTDLTPQRRTGILDNKSGFVY